MRFSNLSFIFLGAVFCLTSVTVMAQDSVFNDPGVAYSFSVPDSKWKISARPSATSPNVEYIYGQRRDGHFEVRRLTVPKNTILTDLIQEDEQKRQFLPGYVGGKEENFAGKLRGSIFNFEYVQAGTPMSGRYYFLRADDTTVYVLRFTGQKGVLRSLQNQTDAIARTFSVRP